MTMLAAAFLMLVLACGVGLFAFTTENEPAKVVFVVLTVLFLICLLNTDRPHG